MWIISKQLQISPSDTLDQLQAPLDQPLYDAALAIANERIQTRKPLAYILEEAWLMGVPFYCNEQSIVPRSWIAELITEGALEAWLPADGRALDLCTGNGSLAVLLALSCPERNLDRHGLSNQIELFHGDLWSPLPDPTDGNRFDLIICNPPYVNAASMRTLPAEYHAEPVIALAGGEDGMDLIRKIIANAPDYLSERGALVLEIGNEVEHFHKAFPQIPVIWMDVSAGNEQVLLIHAEDLR